MRNTIAALWVGFAVPLACVWVLLADQHAWIEIHPRVAFILLVIFVEPLLFIGCLEVARRRPLARLDAVANNTGRSEAIRRLVELGLKVKE